MVGKTVVVGFGYRARTGKDTAVRAIVDTFLEVNARRYAFADALKDEVDQAALDRWLPGQVGITNCVFTPGVGLKCLCEWAGVPYDPAAEKQRELLQWWGMWRRKRDPNYWIKRVEQKIAAERQDFALISDVRFRNEFDFCDVRVKMVRPGFSIDAGGGHVSEHELDAVRPGDWDCTITAGAPGAVKDSAIEFFMGQLRRRVKC